MINRQTIWYDRLEAAPRAVVALFAGAEGQIGDGPDQLAPGDFDSSVMEAFGAGVSQDVQLLRHHSRLDRACKLMLLWLRYDAYRSPDSVYRHVLALGRVAGNATLAEQVWAELQDQEPSEGTQARLECLSTLVVRGAQAVLPEVA